MSRASLEKFWYDEMEGGKMNNGEKRPIPGTNKGWNRTLPDGDINSLVDAYGGPCDYGWNFDEEDDDEDEGEEDGDDEKDDSRKTPQ